MCEILLQAAEQQFVEEMDFDLFFEFVARRQTDEFVNADEESQVVS